MTRGVKGAKGRGEGGGAARARRKGGPFSPPVGESVEAARRRLARGEAEAGAWVEQRAASAFEHDVGAAAVPVCEPGDDCAVGRRVAASDGLCVRVEGAQFAARDGNDGAERREGFGRG